MVSLFYRSVSENFQHINRSYLLNKLEKFVTGSVFVQILFIWQYTYLTDFWQRANLKEKTCGTGNELHPHRLAQLNLELVARYLAELTLLDYNFLRYLPSEIATSAVFLAKWALDPSSHPWNENLRVQTGYHSKDLKICVQNLKKFQKNIKRSDYNTIYVKFQRKKAYALSLVGRRHAPVSLLDVV
ncbi:Cyclin-A2-4 [Carex littledalei]|uniref:Cyclin-A2-4 n=1 Tax=Carex littledalei TaxID=544730 RepID=A0A833QYF4_9POAL|nr:Cyclin-A2-4 [Carex littledalei]